MNSNTVKKGRGTFSLPKSRYNSESHEAVDDGWNQEEFSDRRPTILMQEFAKSILTRNNSPDIPFEISINPYQGCEHGCIYCYARPSHAYLGLSPGLDFETQIVVKSNAASLLRKEFSAKNYRCSPLALGANTDPYQPAERKQQKTREILSVLHEFKHPCYITTKSSLVERDMDILQDMAKDRLIEVNISLTTLVAELARLLEPRASSPKRRLDTIQSLANQGIPVNVMVAPVIPVLTDHELENILSHAADAGANSANYILLRLPLEVADMFVEWLTEHKPDMASHVMNRIQDCRGGKRNDARFVSRLQGEGLFADLIANRFNLAIKKLNLMRPAMELNSLLFNKDPLQMDLFNQ